MLPLSPRGWFKNAKCRKFEQEAAIGLTPKWYEMGRQLVLITNSLIGSRIRAFD